MQRAPRGKRIEVVGDREEEGNRAVEVRMIPSKVVEGEAPVEEE
jgi:hypothetical protein